MLFLLLLFSSHLSAQYTTAVCPVQTAVVSGIKNKQVELANKIDKVILFDNVFSALKGTVRGVNAYEHKFVAENGNVYIPCQGSNCPTFSYSGLNIAPYQLNKLPSGVQFNLMNYFNSDQSMFNSDGSFNLGYEFSPFVNTGESSCTCGTVCADNELCGKANNLAYQMQAASGNNPNIIFEPFNPGYTACASGTYGPGCVCQAGAPGGYNCGGVFVNGLIPISANNTNNFFSIIGCACSSFLTPIEVLNSNNSYLPSGNIILECPICPKIHEFSNNMSLASYQLLSFLYTELNNNQSSVNAVFQNSACSDWENILKNPNSSSCSFGDIEFNQPLMPAISVLKVPKEYVFDANNNCTNNNSITYSSSGSLGCSSVDGNCCVAKQDKSYTILQGLNNINTKKIAQLTTLLSKVYSYNYSQASNGLTDCINKLNAVQKLQLTLEQKDLVSGEVKLVELQSQAQQASKYSSKLAKINTALGMSMMGFFILMPMLKNFLKADFIKGLITSIKDIPKGIRAAASTLSSDLQNALSMAQEDISKTVSGILSKSGIGVGDEAIENAATKALDVGVEEGLKMGTLVADAGGEAAEVVSQMAEEADAVVVDAAGEELAADVAKIL